MTRKNLLALGPRLLVGGGIIGSTLIAVLTAEFGWWVLTGPLLLALAFVGADLLNSRRRGGSSLPSPRVLIMGCSIILAGLVVAFRDPDLVKVLIPVIGPTYSVAFLVRPDDRRKVCRYI